MGLVFAVFVGFNYWLFTVVLDWLVLLVLMISDIWFVVYVLINLVGFEVVLCYFVLLVLFWVFKAVVVVVLCYLDVWLVCCLFTACFCFAKLIGGLLMFDLIVFMVWFELRCIVLLSLWVGFDWFGWYLGLILIRVMMVVTCLLTCLIDEVLLWLLSVFLCWFYYIVVCNSFNCLLLYF